MRRAAKWKYRMYTLMYTVYSVQQNGTNGKSRPNRLKTNVRNSGAARRPGNA